MTAQRKQRRFWQVHPSTAIVLALIAVLLLLLNLFPDWAEFAVVADMDTAPHVVMRQERVGCGGWPFELYELLPKMYSPRYCFRYLALAGNVLVGLAILSGGWYASERLVLWHERRQARLQMHLSTGVILSLVAGGLLWANLVPSVRAETVVITRPNLQSTEFEILETPTPCQELKWGWPLTCVEKPLTTDLRELHRTALAANVGLAVLALCCVCVFAEYCILRRERQP